MKEDAGRDAVWGQSPVPRSAFRAPRPNGGGMSTTLTRSTEAQMRGFTREAVEALSAAKGETEWDREARLASWATYEATAMPTQQDEEWRRTSLRPLKLDQVIPFGVGSPPQGSVA